METYLVAILILLAWVVGMDVILAFEHGKGYPNIGIYQFSKVIKLLIAWPVIYPYVVITRSWAA